MMHMWDQKWAAAGVVCFLSSSVFAAVDWTVQWEKPSSMQQYYQAANSSEQYMASAASMLANRGYGNATSIFSVLQSNSGSFGTKSYDAANWYLNSYYSGSLHNYASLLTFSSTSGVSITSGGGFVESWKVNVTSVNWWPQVQILLHDCAQLTIDGVDINGVVVHDTLLWGWTKYTYWQDSGYHYDTNSDPSIADCRIIDGFIKTSLDTGTDINTLNLVDNGHGGLCLQYQTPGNWIDYNLVTLGSGYTTWVIAGHELTEFTISIVMGEVEEVACPEPASLGVLAVGAVMFLSRRRR